MSGGDLLPTDTRSRSFSAIDTVAPDADDEQSEKSAVGARDFPRFLPGNEAHMRQSEVKKAVEREACSLRITSRSPSFGHASSALLSNQ